MEDQLEHYSPTFLRLDSHIPTRPDTPIPSHSDTPTAPQPYPSAPRFFLRFPSPSLSDSSSSVSTVRPYKPNRVKDTVLTEGAEGPQTVRETQDMKAPQDVREREDDRGYSGGRSPPVYPYSIRYDYISRSHLVPSASTRTRPATGSILPDPQPVGLPPLTYSFHGTHPVDWESKREQRRRYKALVLTRFPFTPRRFFYSKLLNPPPGKDVANVVPSWAPPTPRLPPVEESIADSMVQEDDAPEEPATPVERPQTIIPYVQQANRGVIPLKTIWFPSFEGPLFWWRTRNAGFMWELPWCDLRAVRTKMPGWWWQGYRSMRENQYAVVKRDWKKKVEKKAKGMKDSAERDENLVKDVVVYEKKPKRKKKKRAKRDKKEYESAGHDEKAEEKERKKKERKEKTLRKIDSAVDGKKAKRKKERKKDKKESGTAVDDAKAKRRKERKKKDQLEHGSAIPNEKPFEKDVVAPDEKRTQNGSAVHDKELAFNEVAAQEEKGAGNGSAPQDKDGTSKEVATPSGRKKKVRFTEDTKSITEDEEIHKRVKVEKIHAGVKGTEASKATDAAKSPVVEKYLKAAEDMARRKAAAKKESQLQSKATEKPSPVQSKTVDKECQLKGKKTKKKGRTKEEKADTKNQQMEMVQSRITQLEQLEKRTWLQTAYRQLYETSEKLSEEEKRLKGCEEAISRGEMTERVAEAVKSRAWEELLQMQFREAYIAREDQEDDIDQEDGTAQQNDHGQQNEHGQQSGDGQQNGDEQQQTGDAQQHGNGQQNEQGQQNVDAENRKENNKAKGNEKGTGKGSKKGKKGHGKKSKHVF